MPRVKQFDQEEAVMKAMNLFWEKGFASTSLSDLTQELGIGKGSFYDTFQGKRELFETAFERYSTVNIANLNRMLESEAEVQKGVRKMLGMVLDMMLGDTQHKGCFAVNTCSEMGGSDPEMSVVLNQHNDKVRAILTTYLEKGSYANNQNPEILANTLLLFMAGLQQEVKINQDRQLFEHSIELVMRMFE